MLPLRHEISPRYDSIGSHYRAGHRLLDYQAGFARVEMVRPGTGYRAASAGK